MAVNFLRSAPQKIYNYTVKFGQQTALHGPKYFLNHGSIDGGKEIKQRLQANDKNFIIDMSRFDR